MIYGKEPAWKLQEREFDLTENANRESLYTLANGYIGMRGDLEEKLDAPYSKRGTFINGFYESSTIPYGESAYGFAKNTQTMLNVCDAKRMELYLDEERFTVTAGEFEDYCRELDMKAGLETRTFLWKSPKKRRVSMTITRLVSLERKHIAAIRYEVCPVDFDGEIRLETILDGNTRIGEETDDPRIGGSLGDGGFAAEEMAVLQEGGEQFCYVRQATKRTGLSVACAVLERTDAGNAMRRVEDGCLVSAYRVKARRGQTVTIDKFISYVTDQWENREDYREKALHYGKEAAQAGWDRLMEEQRGYLQDFWSFADVEVLGDEELTRSMRFNIFQLLQSVGRDSHTSIAAKGLSGEGYGGHYFWESEAYIMPVFMMSAPHIARKMLEYRYGILDKAREQAKLMGHKKGALYSWRSIDGEESSAFFPAGSAQYHISADVAFGVSRYVDATGDMEFLQKYGLEILLETARVWMEAGHFSRLRAGQFCIDDVTGPDEYTAIVDNNCYTNVMARENLWNATEAARKVREEAPKAYDRVCARIGFDESELADFIQAADRMYIPYNEELGIHMQDDTFLYKKVLDLSRIPEDKHPLLLHYHPLFIYRHQVCKQADLILAEYFLPTRFSAEDKKRDYHYYERVTTHDSSLSACVFSVMAAEIGEEEKAYEYFVKTVRTDLDDNQKNTRDGLHMANMAGAWTCIVNGFAGLRAIGGQLCFRPILPKHWKGYRFCVTYRGSVLEIRADGEGTRYCLKKGESLTIRHNGLALTVPAKEEVFVSKG